MEKIQMYDGDTQFQARCDQDLAYEPDKEYRDGVHFQAMDTMLASIDNFEVYEFHYWSSITRKGVSV